MFVSSGESRLNCPTPSIEVAEGDDVTLQCHLDPSIDVSAHTADWSRVDNDEVAYSYRNKRQNHDAQTERYRGRTTVNLDGLSTGDLTLQISLAQLDDSGLYKCYVLKLGISCDVNVSVGEQPAFNTEQIILGFFIYVHNEKAEKIEFCFTFKTFSI